MRHLIALPVALLVPIFAGCIDEAAEGPPDAAVGDASTPDGIVGDASNPDATPVLRVPRITGLSRQKLVVGETLEFHGEGFLDGDAGVTRLRFEGEFVADDGTREPVRSLVVTPVVDREVGPSGEAGRVLRWSRFGPFDNPFHSADRPGVFQGFVIAENVVPDGTVTSDPEPRRFALEVEPSLIIEELQPLEAECSAPALRALAGIPYRIRVRAVGLRPVRFEYAISHVNGQAGVTTFTHEYGADTPVAEDHLGDDEPVVFNPVPPDVQSYVTVIRVVARDADGRVVETALPLTVHRPIEVSYDGRRERAEVFPPVAVSGCIPSGVRTEITYRELQSETRQQTVNFIVRSTFMEELGQQPSAEWLDGIGTGESVSRSLGGATWEGERAPETYGVAYELSDANRIDYGSTNGEVWSWEVPESESYEAYMERMRAFFGEGSLSTDVGVEGEASIPGFAAVTGSVQTTTGVTAGARTRGTGSGRRGRSGGRGWSAAGSHDETRSFGSTTTEMRSHAIDGAYALGRSPERTFHDIEARDRSRVWTLGGAATIEDAVGTGMTEAERRTWVSSETDEAIRSFSGRIPRDKVGVLFRQTVRWVKRAEVRAYDLCGLATHLGELQLNHWSWVAGLGIAERCDVVPPPPDLPPAECFIEPCGG